MGSCRSRRKTRCHVMRGNQRGPKTWQLLVLRKAGTSEPKGQVPTTACPQLQHHAPNRYNFYANRNPGYDLICKHGGSFQKPAHIDCTRVRQCAYCSITPTSTSHHIRLHYATYTTTTDRTSSGCYNRPAKWPRDHHGGRFSSKAQSKRRRRGGAR